MWGAPDYPVIYASHPVGGLANDVLRQRAAELMDEVVAVLTGVEASHLAATH